MAVASIDGFDEVKLKEVIAKGLLDFDAWCKLISDVEARYHDDIDKISLVYDSFLSEFPLCYCYWKKYADHNARLCNVEKAVQVFEQAVESAPYSVDVWADYCNYSISIFEDPSDVCRLFQRALSFVGKDYRCHTLWDKYIEFEFAQQHWSSLAHIYIQTLKFPTKRLHHYYDCFKKLVAIWDEQMGCLDSLKFHSVAEPGGEAAQPADGEILQIVDELLDPSTRSNALKKYLFVGRMLYEKSGDLDAKIHQFEKKICRPYFHVKPLDDNQLENWHRYLDFVEVASDFDWAVKLYERCLIPCASYPDFWMRYVEYLESKGGREMANDALDRASQIFLKNVPVIHIFKARFKEQAGDIDGAHAAFVQCDPELDFCFVESIVKKANMERRAGNYVAASNTYKESLEVAKEKKSKALAMLYANFARLQYQITNSVEATREVLLDGIRLVPHSKFLLEELIRFALMHEGAFQVEVVDAVISDALSLTSDVACGLSAKDQEDISRQYLEFIDFCGTIHDASRAWSRHLKLFPHSVRAKSSDMKAVRAGDTLKVVTEERQDNLLAYLRKYPQGHTGIHLIDHPQQEEKPSPEDNINHPDRAIHHEPRRSQNGFELSAGHVDQAANDVDSTLAMARDSKSDGVQQEQGRGRGQEQTSDPELGSNPNQSPSRASNAPNDASRENGSLAESGQNNDRIPTISRQGSPRVDDSTQIFDGFVSPRTGTAGEKAAKSSSNKFGNRRDVSSSRNSEERQNYERSPSPRWHRSQNQSDDRRWRRSLSPRRDGSRDQRFGERHHRRHSRYQDNSRFQRDGRNRNQNQAPRFGFTSQTTVPVQPVPYGQAQINQYPIQSGDQIGNLQNSEAYNQMWQYYYYQQQQLLMQQQVPYQQQQLQPFNPQQTQQHQIQTPQQQQPIQFDPQQLLQLQQQLLQQQQQQQQQQAEQQPLQLYEQQQQTYQQVPNQEQQQQQLQMYHQYQQFQQQQYLMYLQQQQQIQQQKPQQLPEQQQLPVQPGQEVLQQQQRQTESQQQQQIKDQESQPQQDGGSAQLDSWSSNPHKQGKGVEGGQSPSSTAAAASQSQQQVSKTDDGTDAMCLS